MLSLVDGPCKGTYMCQRAPMYLRAVKDKDGKKDALDQITDTPGESETVHVYKLDGIPGTVHLYGPKISGWYAMGIYHHMTDVDGEVLRDNIAWQAWATAQKETTE